MSARLFRLFPLRESLRESELRAFVDPKFSPRTYTGFEDICGMTICVRGVVGITRRWTGWSASGLGPSN